MLADAYEQILDGVEVDPAKRGVLAIDSAHGIGAPKVVLLKNTTIPLSPLVHSIGPSQSNALQCAE